MEKITDAEFVRIRDFIKAKYGIKMNDEKKPLIYSRLRTVLAEGGFKTFTQYFDHLINDKSGETLNNFVNRVTTNHTFFMRETEHFDFLRDTVLPYLEETYSHQKEVRLWCAGCSTGEEPNVLQMILQDYFENKSWDTNILATDISSNALDRAMHSVYPDSRVAALPESWRKKYFRKFDNGNYIVADRIKNNITYRRFNLMESIYPFKKKIHVIFCRNVMIYFDDFARKHVAEKFYDIVDEGGYIFIGHSESLRHTDINYKYVIPAVYRKM